MYSITVLNLTINQSDNTSSSVISCDSYTWDGNTYSVSGTYTNAYTNSLGCDSTHTLNLTIKNSSTGTTTVTACDSYIWDGNTYSVSGTYTNVYTNSVGCDSTHTLNLTINQSDTSFTNITACDSIVWNGTTYNQTGNYTYNGGNNALNVPGFTYGGFFVGSYYYISNSSTTWSQGNQLAQNNGGNMVTISSQVENDFVSNLTTHNIWLGFVEQGSNYNFGWVTGESVSFINWDPQQPTGLGTVSIMFGYDDPASTSWGINGQWAVASDVVYPSNGILAILL